MKNVKMMSLIVLFCSQPKYIQFTKKWIDYQD